MDAAFVRRLEEAVGKPAAEAFLCAMKEPAATSVRLNPSKCEGVHLPILEGAEKVPWSPWGHILTERPVFTLHPLFHAGVYYVQDSSAMFVGEVLRKVLPDVKRVRVLDLCAAPGGKTTDVAASLRSVYGDDFLLVANEPMRKRATVLADNVAKWGDPNVVVTTNDPKDFSSLKGFFDIVIADVPCSGEGMFRKDDEALRQWSEDNVALCASRQKRIVADVWPALKQGGTLIYSTCTFNSDENDLNAGWIMENLGAEVCCDELPPDGIIKTKYGYSLVPGLVPGEGQYCSALRKISPEEEMRVKVRGKFEASKRLAPLFGIEMTEKEKGGLVIAVPANIAQDAAALEERLSVVSAGCAVGNYVKRGELVPDEDLALCIKLSDEAFPSAEVDKKTALSFLHKDTFLLEDASLGIVLIRYKGVPLGFVKNMGTRINNLHPLSRRIRMDIE